MKKTCFSVIVGVLAIAVMVGGSWWRAHAASSSGIPLSSLAGSFAGQDSANFGLCFNQTFTALQACNITPLSQVVPWNNSHASQYTQDSKGNACGEGIGPSAPFPPGNQPAGVDDNINVSVMTSYNPATGSGFFAFKGYSAGPGVGCEGAVFVNTANAPVMVTGTGHIVVSQNGNRIDGLLLTVHTTSPVDFIAGFVQHSFSTRQTNENQQ